MSYTRRFHFSIAVSKSRVIIFKNGEFYKKIMLDHPHFDRKLTELKKEIEHARRICQFSITGEQYLDAAAYKVVNGKRKAH